MRIYTFTANRRQRSFTAQTYADAEQAFQKKYGFIPDPTLLVEIIELPEEVKNDR